MSLLDYLKFGSKKRSKPPLDEKSYVGGSDYFLQNNPYTPYKPDLGTYVKKGYLSNPHVFTITSFSCRSLSQVPWGVFEIKDTAKGRKSFQKYLELKDKEPVIARLYKNEALEAVPDSSLNRLIENPNPQQSWPDFFYEIAGWKKLTGNSFIAGTTALGFPSDLVAEMHPLPSPVMQVIPTTLGDIAGFKTRDGYNNKQTFTKEEVLFVKEWHPGNYMRSLNDPDYLLGMSMYEPLIRVVQRSNESYDASIGMIRNGLPAGILSAKTQIGPGSNPDIIEDHLQDQWNQKFEGAKNWSKHKVLFSGRDLSWSAIGFDPKQLGLNETDQIDFLTLTRAAGIPIDLFSTGDSTYTNKNEARRDVWQTNFLPELKIWRDNFNKWLVPAYSKLEGRQLFMDYDVSSISVLQPDLKELSQRLTNEMDFALWNGNDVRVMLGREVGSSPHLEEYILSNRRQFINRDIETPQNENASNSENQKRL